MDLTGEQNIKKFIQSGGKIVIESGLGGQLYVAKCYPSKDSVFTETVYERFSLLDPNFGIIAGLNTYLEGQDEHGN